MNNVRYEKRVLCWSVGPRGGAWVAYGADVIIICKMNERGQTR